MGDARRLRAAGCAKLADDPGHVDAGGVFGDGPRLERLGGRVGCTLMKVKGPERLIDPAAGSDI